MRVNLNKKREGILFLALAIILLAFLVFPHSARAGWLDLDFFSSTLGSVVNSVVTLILNFVEQAISFFADLFDKFIRWQTGNAIYGVVVVDQSWTIIRNFVNMFFILILIVMAFGTIFDIKGYSWNSGRPPMLVAFIISALLVNFSLTIGQYIIAVANGLSGIFLKQIGQVSGTFAQGFNIVGTATSGATDLISGTGQVVVTVIFAVIFLTIVMLAFAAAAIFSLVRILVLWFLLIISPIAWIGYSLPGLRAQTWSAWWKHFFCWCFFLPYYLFFMMFAVIFVKNRGTIPPIPGGGSTAGMTGTDFLFYALSLAFLIGGLVVARKMACATGKFASTQIFGKIEAGVRRYAPGAAYVRGGVAGLKARGEEIQEKGVLGIGGAQRARIAEAGMKGWIAGIPGLGRVPGAREAADRARLEEIDKKELPRLKEELQRLPADQQKAFLQTAQGRKGVAGEAALLEYVKQGYSKLEDYRKAMDKFGGENTVLGRQYLENLKQAKLSDLFSSPDEELSIAMGRTPDGRVLDTERFRELRRALFMDLAKRNRIKSIGDYEEAKKLLKPTPAEWKSFIEAVKPEYMFGDKDKRADALLNWRKEIGDTDLAKKLVDYMSDKEHKEITDWKMREAALQVVGGKDSLDGKTIINTINKYNPIINIEADVRAPKGDPTEDLTDSEKDSIKNYAIGELLKKTPEDAAKLSSDFFSNGLTRDALENALYLDPDEPITEDYIEALIKVAPPKTRKVLRQILPEQKKK